MAVTLREARKRFVSGILVAIACHAWHWRVLYITFIVPRHAFSTYPLSLALSSFNQLCLPYYSSFEEMQKKLLLAINEGSEGFGFAWHLVTPSHAIPSTRMMSFQDWLSVPTDSWFSSRQKVKLDSPVRLVLWLDSREIPVTEFQWCVRKMYWCLFSRASARWVWSSSILLTKINK